MDLPQVAIANLMFFEFADGVERILRGRPPVPCGAGKNASDFGERPPASVGVPTAQSDESERFQASFCR